MCLKQMQPSRTHHCTPLSVVTFRFNYAYDFHRLFGKVLMVIYDDNCVEQDLKWLVWIAAIILIAESFSFQILCRSGWLQCHYDQSSSWSVSGGESGGGLSLQRWVRGRVELAEMSQGKGWVDRDESGGGLSWQRWVNGRVELAELSQGEGWVGRGESGGGLSWQRWVRGRVELTEMSQGEGWVGFNYTSSNYCDSYY